MFLSNIESARATSVIVYILKLFQVEYLLTLNVSIHCMHALFVWMFFQQGTA